MARSLSERFDRQVDRSGHHHHWLGSINSDRGTGQLRVEGKLTTAQRVAWELEHGATAPGGRVLPCPDEPTCVRVEHLSIASSGGRSSRRFAARARATRGTGSKREVRPGVWELTVTAGRDSDDQLRRVFRTVRGSQADATRALSLLVAEVGDGRALPPRATRGRTLDELITGYLEHLLDHKGSKHSTLVRYRGLAKKWISPALGGRRADGVLPQDIEAVLGTMRRAGRSQSSIHQTFTLLNGTYRWARRNRYVSHSPVTDAEEPRSLAVPHDVVPPDIARLRQLLAAAFEKEPEFGMLCHLGAVTGMRRGELAGLRWDRVDLAQGRVRVEITVNDAGGQVVIDNFTKTRNARAVSIDAGTIALLSGHRAAMEARAAEAGGQLVDAAFVFSHSPTCSTPVRPEYLTRRMRHLRRDLGLDAANIDATLQALRHWTQTTLTEAGYNSRQVAARGGHSEELMKAVYVHRTVAAEELMSNHVGSLLAPDPT